VFGVTGFGASPITVPVLAHFLPLPFVLPLAAALDLGSAVTLGVHTKKQADVRELLVLAPFTIIGLALGVTLLVRLPRDATLLALGGFVCCYALYIVLYRGPRRPLGRAWAAPAGLLSGVLGALFGVGGPPYVVYIAGRILDPIAQRATISQMVALNVGLRVAAFAIAGLSPAATCGSRSGCFFRSRGRASGRGIGRTCAWRRQRWYRSLVLCSSSAAFR
jgi:uncharacterized protein